MVLTVFGVSHKTSTVEEREPFQLSRRDLGEAVLRYKRLTGVDEVIIAATCNRVEFYRAHRTKGRQGLEIVEFYKDLGVPDPDRILEVSYRHVGAGAARHLFRVTSGMDSLLVGEEQVHGQIKDAYSSACAFGGAGKVLHKLFHYAFRVSKRIRSETSLAAGARSIPGTAVELLLGNHPNPKSALVIGADETTEIVLAALQRRSIPAVLVNRTGYTAQKLAGAYGATTAEWSQLPSALERVDLVFSATGADSFVVTPDMIDSRKSQLFVADLAIPRDIHPAVGGISGVQLFDLQDLKYQMERLEERRCSHLPVAQGLIEEQVDGFLEWLHSQSFAGGIEQLKHELHTAANDELNRFIGSFHQSEKKALEAFSHAVIKRFLKIGRRHFEPHGLVENVAMLRLDPSLIEEPLPIDEETGESRVKKSGGEKS